MMARLLEIWSRALQWFIDLCDVPHVDADDDPWADS